METLVLLGKKIKMLRQEKELTQAKLAEECDLSNNFIAMLERGIHAPSIETLEKLAKALDISISELFEFDNETERQLLRKDKREKAIRKLLQAKSDKDVKLIADIANLIWKSKR